MLGELGTTHLLDYGMEIMRCGLDGRSGVGKMVSIKLKNNKFSRCTGKFFMKPFQKLYQI